jgi:glycosyltransferase involved in cell wall biosynthesis
MNPYKPIVSIGVPAYNEEANIRYLLNDLLSQKQDTFVLNEIVVISDGSTDNTVAIAKTFASEKIRVVNDGKRTGKLKRLNDLFETFTGDILVQFDADVRLSNSTVVEELVKPFLADRQTALVCGNHKPSPPKGFIERAAVFGVQVWDDALDMLGERAGRYRCSGQIRAFSREFLQGFRFPLDIGSGEDTYSFYYAKVNTFKVTFARNALVYHRLPTTLGDYTRQMSRFIYAKNQMSQYFAKEQCATYETMTASVRIKALVKNVFKSSPLTVMGFLILHIAPRISVLTYEHKRLWDVAKTSKNLA